MRSDSRLDVRQVHLDMIEEHPVYSELQVLEYLVCVDFLLPVPAKFLSFESVMFLLNMHPVFVIPGKQDKYYCVGGLRSLNIARNSLPKVDSIIPVLFVTGIKKSEIREFCIFDIIATSLCFSVQSPDIFCKFIGSLPKELKNKLFSNKLGPTRISKMLNVSRESIRKWMQKPLKNS